MRRKKEKISKFESIGIYTPENIVTTKDLMDQMDPDSRVELESITGIKTRRKRTRGEDSFTIALGAAQNCLKNSKYDAKDIDIIINTAITRFKDGLTFHFDPPFSLWIKNALGASNAMDFDLTNACAGMMTGAQILDNMIKAGIVRNGMVVSGECITPIADTAVKEIKEVIDPQFASLTVGDAGGAFILDKSTDANIGIEHIEMKTWAKYADLCYGMPSDKNEGVAMYTDAKGIHEAALATLPLYVGKMLKTVGLDIENVDIFVPHQTSVKAIKKLSELLTAFFPGKKLPKFLIFVDEYGNTASTAILLAFFNALQQGIIKEGQRVIFMVIASGLVIGFIVFVVDRALINSVTEKADS